MEVDLLDLYGPEWCVCACVRACVIANGRNCAGGRGAAEGGQRDSEVLGKEGGGGRRSPGETSVLAAGVITSTGGAITSTGGVTTSTGGVFTSTGGETTSTGGVITSTGGVITSPGCISLRRKWRSRARRT